MLDIQSLMTTIKTAAASGGKSVLTGRNALVRDTFDFLFQRTKFPYELLLLCTKKGLILNFYSSLPAENLSGCSIDIECLTPYHQSLAWGDALEDYVIIAAISDRAIPIMHQLQSNLKKLLAIFDAEKSEEQYLLNCFDAVENPICIYDEKASLLYGNKSYFKSMHIYNKQDAIGKNIQDITKEEGIKIHPAKVGSGNLKMMDVLQKGKKALDWEVTIESETSAGQATYMSNNMYPIKDTRGKVQGMIEIAYSHQIDLDKTKKIMGLSAEYTFDSIIGESPVMQEKKKQAKEYAGSPYNLLIIGESGVGKELFAQSIHNYSDRSGGPFVALNCASFPENLIESELFGYVGGAFTGASKNGQIGKFELADGGTLFLDEIGELPYHFQSKLLRVLETRKITRIGSSAQTPVNVRVVAATNRNLEKMIDEGLFRKDLYYRLQVLNIEIPPLRERREDLLLLTDAFFKQASLADGDGNNRVKHLDSKAQECLISYDWPGNVRELRNVIHRITLLSKTDTVPLEVLEAAIYSKGYALKEEHPSDAAEDNAESTLEQCFAEVNSAYAKLVETALNVSGGNKSQAAELLGVSRMTFYRMIEKYCE